MSAITQDCLNTVLALGIKTPLPNNPNNVYWIGTGFLVGFKEAGQSEVYLITNKHVVQGANAQSLVVRFNAQGDKKANDLILVIRDQTDAIQYSQHPNEKVDIIAVSVNTQLLSQTQSIYNYFDFTSEACTLSIAKQNGIMEGSIVFALGFPMNLVEQDRQSPICRMGCISRIANCYIQKNSKEFLIDAQTFPGNSGGPVVTNELSDGSSNMAKLLGIVCAYIPYRESLYSRQTERERSVMEENSGLTVVQPVDRIREVVDIERNRITLMQQ